MAMTVGSLFAGIGGLELGLEWCGMETRWQVELDPYARRVLEKHWPNVRRHDDIRTWPQPDTEPVDLICGGFPCQDISTAGKGAGIIHGERSGLYFEMLRVIREMGPRFVVLENVSNLLVRGLDVVLGTLAEVGFDAEWHCVTAAHLGAPHRRDRIFIIGYHHREGQPAGPVHAEKKPRLPEYVAHPGGQGASECGRPGRHRKSKGGTPESGGKTPRPEDGEARPDLFTGRGQAVADTQSVRVEGDRTTGEQVSRVPPGEGVSRRNGAGCRTEKWAVEPALGRVAHGVPHRVDRLRALGNAVVPQVAEFIGRRVLEIEKETNQCPRNT